MTARQRVATVLGMDYDTVVLHPHPGDFLDKYRGVHRAAGPRSAGPARSPAGTWRRVGFAAITVGVLSPVVAFSQTGVERDPVAVPAFVAPAIPVVPEVSPPGPLYDDPMVTRLHHPAAASRSSSRRVTPTIRVVGPPVAPIPVRLAAPIRVELPHGVPSTPASLPSASSPTRMSPVPIGSGTASPEPDCSKQPVSKQPVPVLPTHTHTLTTPVSASPPSTPVTSPMTGGSSGHDEDDGGDDDQPQQPPTELPTTTSTATAHADDDAVHDGAVGPTTP